MSRPDVAAETLGRMPSVAAARLEMLLEVIAFWGAVLLPLVYVPALITGSSPSVIASIVALNVACLVLGHRHTPRFDGDILAILAAVLYRKEES